MVAGTNSSARGRGITRKLLGGRTPPKDLVTAQYKAHKNPVGRPRSKSRAKSADTPKSRQEASQEDLEIEDTPENIETDIQMLNSDTSDKEKSTQQSLATPTTTAKRKEREEKTGETTRKTFQ
jgi:hypothetical protein